MQKIYILLVTLFSGLLLATSCSSEENKETESAMPTMKTNQDPLELFVTRRSIRSYSDELPTKEQLEKIALAGSYAPSAMGKQPATIVVVSNRQTRDQLATLSMRVRNREDDTFYGAPAVLVVLADSDLSPTTYLQDAALVVGNMQNMAHALGLGSCWINSAFDVFNTTEGKELLKQWGVSEKLVGVSFCVVGVPAETPQATPRKENYIIAIE